MTRICRWVLCMGLLGLATPVLAEQYRVDIIVYRDETGYGSEQPLPARAPDLTNVVEPGDAAGLRAAGITLVPDEAFGLNIEWKHLANSKRHKPVLRLAWVQEDPPSENGPGLRLRSGAPLPFTNGDSTSALYPIDGSVRLLMGRFLHLEADMSYTVRHEDGQLASYRMNERRRMRRKEVHHIDSPRLGLLARVLKVERDEPTP